MLNPITYTEQVVSDFLRYQISTYAFADKGLYEQMRVLLDLEHARATPLMKGPSSRCHALLGKARRWSNS